jgi:Alpha/beta hydrolase domain
MRPALLVSIALSTLAIPISVQATVTSVKVDYTAPFGTFSGRDYVYVEATMKGSFTRADSSAGTYSIPIVLIKPDNDPGNGFGVVDMPNTVYFVIYNFEMCFRPPSLAPDKYTHLWCNNGEKGLRLANTIYPLAWQSTETYLFEQGYTYMAVQWDAAVTGTYGDGAFADGRKRLAYGKIENGNDWVQILGDASEFLRAPGGVFDGGAATTAPTAVRKVIGFGWSQTAMMLRDFLLGGKNRRPDNSLVFDGTILAVAGAMTYVTNNTPPYFSPTDGTGSYIRPGVPPPDGKVMAVQTQSESFMRLQTARPASVTDPNYRDYEVAGVTHIPTPILDVSYWGGWRQNPETTRPYFRAAFYNMYHWINDNIDPPPSKFIDGTEDSTRCSSGPLPGQTNSCDYNFTTDADGNVTGGIRSPHMPSVTTAGMPAGAPLGTYGGLEPGGFPTPAFGGPPGGNWDPTTCAPYCYVPNIFQIMGGTYTKFSPDEIARRYPDQATFQDLRTRAADQLLADRYILKEDRDLIAAGIAR